MTFDPTELIRLDACFRRFLPHARRTEVALTGGIAMRMHLAATRGAIADIDFVATRIEAIDAAVTGDLLVSHYHLPQPGDPKFMMQFVDPVSRLRVDVFPDLAGSIASAQRRVVAQHELLVLDASSILAHKVLTLSKATPEHPVDHKHQDDAMMLAGFCGQHVDPLPVSCLTAAVYGKDLRGCPRCEASRSTAFPLASKQHVFDILGYT